ncbi:glycosyltransferase family 2 protein [Stratiformator vulcanicus]|uniref:Undecaprenyl-phosphate mannosyltransferase n=1 Tax=Stratiformator vulcanicus TaxID=2527980 RepID=A0A517QZP3_9PLAN|nr:glycosyltransferase family 2 protein [Stratiformator vulcanicus]QDT37116.1 Undecaprenyl-phosphate mannosyltransferase [Stratiformator vulcanicus]
MRRSITVTCTTSDMSESQPCRDHFPRRVLTALPVYNEQQHIPVVLREVQRNSCDVLVIDDGSTDGTEELLKSHPGIRVVRHEQNSGYGAALSTAFRYAADEGYDTLVTIDCDGQHEPKLIPELANAVWRTESGKPFDMISGSRYLHAFEGDSAPPVERRDINRKITCVLNEHLGLGLTDAFCGFKAYRVEALASLDIDDPGYAMPLQVWVQAAAAKWRIREFAVPLIYLDEKRSFGGNLDDGRQRFAHYLSVLDAALADSGLPSLALEKLPCG